MKRSEVIKLVLISSSLICLTACEKKQPEQTIFMDKQACLKTLDEAKCEKLYQESLDEHLRIAPKFTTKEECEKVYGEGKCGTPSQTHSSMFMPLMMGFALGKLMNPTPIIPQRADERRGGPYARPYSSSSTTQRGGFGNSGSFFSSSGS